MGLGIRLGLGICDCGMPAPEGGSLDISTDGLVLNLDAGNAASYPGSGTDWFDLTSEGHDSTLINGPTFDSGDGGSIVFDGTRS